MYTALQHLFLSSLRKQTVRRRCRTTASRYRIDPVTAFPPGSAIIDGQFHALRRIWRRSLFGFFFLSNQALSPGKAQSRTRHSLGIGVGGGFGQCSFFSVSCRSIRRQRLRFEAKVRIVFCSRQLINKANILINGLSHNDIEIFKSKKYVGTFVRKF